MRILHLIHSTGNSGAITFAADAVLALQESGSVEQSVLCRGNDILLERLHQGNIPYDLMDFVGWKKWLDTRRIRRRIKYFAPDVVHCWMNRAASFMPCGSGVPSLGWFSAYDKIKRFANCDYYTGVSYDLCDYIRRESGHSDRVFLGHTFGTLPQDEPLSRGEFNIPEDKPVVLMLSRMHREKGVDILLQAAREVDVFLLLVGDGPDLGNFQKLAQDLGIESRACFLDWRSDRSALLELADVIAVPSRSESFGTVIPEAWSKSVPVVAAKAKGPSQYIEHGVNGMLSDIDDVTGLAKNLRSVLEDDALRRRLVSEGKRTYQATFSKDVVISELLATYKEIIRRGPIP